MITLQSNPIKNLPASASFTSAPIDARQFYQFSLQMYGGSGSLAGTFQLQACNVPCVDVFNNYAPLTAQWTNIGTALTSTQTSVASSQMTPVLSSAYVALRVVFTDTSGGTNTAVMNAYLTALGV